MVICQLPLWIAEETDLEKCNFRKFRGPVTLTLNRVIQHSHASVIDLYLHTKFHWNRKNFLWTEGCTDVHTDGHFRPPLMLLGRLWRVDLKLQDGGRWCHLGKIEKSPYLRNGLTDRHEIWHDDAGWPSWLFGLSDFRPEVEIRQFQTCALKNDIVGHNGPV